MAKKKPLAKRAAELLAVEGDDKLSALRAAEKDALRLKARVKLAEDKQAHAERELETLRARVELLTSFKPAKINNVRKPKRHKAANGTAIIVLSDWHVEETVYPQMVGGLNEFNLQIAEQRIARTFDKALLLLEDARQLTEIRQCVVAVLGDLISGFIHPELQEGNSLAPLPATQFAGEHLERGIRKLIQHADIDEFIIPTCYGNHGRTTDKSRIATAADNSYEYNLYLNMAKRFEAFPQVKWKVEEGYHNWLTVQGRDVRFHHGDWIKYQGGVGGPSIPINKSVADWNRARRAYLDIFGHLHTFMPTMRWIMNGSLIGYGPYSVYIKADYQPPMQAFLVLDEERGLTRALPIFCD